MMEPRVEIGSVRKTHGYEGELKLALTGDFGAALAETRFIFIGNEPATALPYELLQRRGGGEIVRLGGVDSKEAATELRGRRVYVPAALVGDAAPAPDDAGAPPTDVDAARAFERFVGYAVIDEDIGEIGAITRVEAYPGQTMATVERDSLSCLVPLTPELIRGVDFTKKIVFMRLPEGLLAL